MNLALEKIIIVKKGLTGEATVKYNLFSINKIVINLNTPVDPIQIAKYDKTAIVSGPLINEIKTQVLEFFQETLGDAPDAIYEFVPEVEFNVTKI